MAGCAAGWNFAGLGFILIGWMSMGYLKHSAALGMGFQVACYSELTKTSTALARLAVTCVLSAARRLVLIFVNSL